MGRSDFSPRKPLLASRLSRAASGGTSAPDATRPPLVTHVSVPTMPTGNYLTSFSCRASGAPRPVASSPDRFPVRLRFGLVFVADPSLSASRPTAVFDYGDKSQHTSASGRT